MLFSLGLAVAAAMSGCAAKQVADFPEPTRYSEMERAPRALFQKDTGEVVQYLEQFKTLADTGKLNPKRIMQVQDQDRYLTATMAKGECTELHVTGRLGDSLFPKSEKDLERLRDTYGGNLDWATVAEAAPVGGLDIDGVRTWRGLDGVVAELNWHYDAPGAKTGTYELEFRQG